MNIKNLHIALPGRASAARPGSTGFRHEGFIKIRYSALLVLLLIACLSACKKFVQIPPSKAQISNTAVFSDSTNATAAVLGIYINMISGTSVSAPFNGQITIYTGMSSDELYTTDLSSSDVQFYQNALNSNSNSQLIWNNCYTTIYQANAIIAGVTASAGISPKAKNQLIGECKLVRALNYFHMLNLFGGVPLVLTTDYKTSGSQPKASAAAIYTQITTDLADAQAEMSASYVTSGKVRPNRYAAEALLAKVYLYQQQWAKAEAAATDVIANGGYTLNDLNDVFLANSNEAIWQLQPVTQGYETPEGSTFLPQPFSSGPPQYGISNFLLNSFENGDLRKTNWINSITASGTTYYYPYKYKLAQDYNSTPLENYMLLRLGEQYLIRAEARAEQNNTAGAIADLNVIHNPTRVGLPVYSGATDQASVLAAIMHERQVELFCELGNRWYDLKRTGAANTVMPAVCTAKGGAWSTNWQLYPIPYTQLQTNPFLVQNPGYTF